jgi:hypothetical protein
MMIYAINILEIRKKVNTRLAIPEGGNYPRLEKN